jgi:hypothetical protein
MVTRGNARQALAHLFARNPVVNLEKLQGALGTASRTTVFRALSEVGYFTSYSHAGRFYTLQHIPDFNEDGIWAHEGVLFSKHRTLRATLVHLVEEAEAGQTHPELETRVHLRVYDTLHDLVGAHLIGRVEIERLYLYVNAEVEAAQSQVAARRRLLTVEPMGGVMPEPTVIIEILLAFIRHPQDDAAALALRLRRHRIERHQVETVLAQYDLGKKNRPWRRSPR